MILIRNYSLAAILRNSSFNLSGTSTRERILDSVRMMIIIFPGIKGENKNVKIIGGS
jgi:hypothetical protein